MPEPPSCHKGGVMCGPLAASAKKAPDQKVRREGRQLRGHQKLPRNPIRMFVPGLYCVKVAPGNWK